MADEVAKIGADPDGGLDETADDTERVPASGSNHPVRMSQNLDGEAVDQSAAAAPEAERASASGSAHPVRTFQALDGETADQPGEDSQAERVSASGSIPSGADNQAQKLKYPRVAPPEVEDAMGQAVREDSPGYIAQAFPKLFPFGTGDFHDLRQHFPTLLSFEEWGRFVMMWHDGRFSRHSRFRYWLLDTTLRLMTPGMKRTFFKTREAASDFTLADLEDKGTRRNLVQQMSSATSKLPGSVGERRNMRQELESMVHHVETETADNGENAGAGRIPAGFCTLTCAIYKWEQLHSTILKSYPPGSASEICAREHYQQWRALPHGSTEKEQAMKAAYYQMALQNPSVVAWYCTLKLEMAVHLVQELVTRMLQSDVVPGRGQAMELLAGQLQERLGVEISVDDLPDIRNYGAVDDFMFLWNGALEGSFTRTLLCGLLVLLGPIRWQCQSTSIPALCKSTLRRQKPSCFPERRLPTSWPPSGIEFTQSSTLPSTCNQAELRTKAIQLQCRESGRAWARSWSVQRNLQRASLGNIFSLLLGTTGSRTRAGSARLLG